MSNTKSGIDLISAERNRQIESEGWTPKHDDSHQSGEMATAGACYSALAAAQSRCFMQFPASEMYPPMLDHLEWPWGDKWWKPSDDPVRNLVKAGALIAAEIDRLQRKAEAKKPISTT